MPAALAGLAGLARVVANLRVEDERAATERAAESPPSP
jgi:hypothetical protein